MLPSPARGKLADVLRGIEAARAVGLQPVKLNMVVMADVNDDEILDFGRKALTEEWHIRFIELMPFNKDITGKPRFVSVKEMKQRFNALGKLEPCKSVLTGNGPAKYFRLPGAKGTIGFISPVTEHFCFSCNRLRLTADGKLRPCLLGDEEIDLRQPLRAGASPDELKRLIQKAVESKPQRHKLAEGAPPGKRPMVQIGG